MIPNQIIALSSLVPSPFWFNTAELTKPIYFLKAVRKGKWKIKFLF